MWSARSRPTIDALLSARLDRLGPGERAVISRAAVVGKEFSAEATVDLLPEDARAFGVRHLETLARKEFIGSARPGDLGAGRRFRHILIQQAAYRATPKSLRAELHERFADWMEGRSSEWESSSRRRLSATTSSRRSAIGRSSAPSATPSSSWHTGPATTSRPRGSRRSSAATCRRRSTCSVGRRHFPPRGAERAWQVAAGARLRAVRDRRGGRGEQRARRRARAGAGRRRSPRRVAGGDHAAPDRDVQGSQGNRPGCPLRRRPRRRSTSSESSATRRAWRGPTWSLSDLHVEPGQAPGDDRRGDSGGRARSRGPATDARSAGRWGRTPSARSTARRRYAEGLRLARARAARRAREPHAGREPRRASSRCSRRWAGGSRRGASAHRGEPSPGTRPRADLAGGRPGAAQRLRRAARRRSGRRRARHARRQGGFRRRSARGGSCQPWRWTCLGRSTNRGATTTRPRSWKRSTSTPAPTDREWQVKRTGVPARLLGQAGTSSRRPRRLAREGVALAADSEFVVLHADVLLDLAEVLRLAGRPEEADATTAEAIGGDQRKGNVAAVARARRAIW